MGHYLLASHRQCAMPLFTARHPPDIGLNVDLPFIPRQRGTASSSMRMACRLMSLSTPAVRSIASTTRSRVLWSSDSPTSSEPDLNASAAYKSVRLRRLTLPTAVQPTLGRSGQCHPYVKRRRRPAPPDGRPRRSRALRVPAAAGPSAARHSPAPE